jgi:hypothetical protein
MEPVYFVSSPLVREKLGWQTAPQVRPATHKNTRLVGRPILAAAAFKGGSPSFLRDAGGATEPRPKEGIIRPSSTLFVPYNDRMQRRQRR